MSRRYRSTGFDLRVTIYQVVKTLLITAAIALFVKISIFDTVRASGDRMAPVIARGDRLLLLRTPFLPLLRSCFKPPYDKPVVYKSTTAPGFFDLLRVAAFSNDTISIDSGIVYTSGKTGNLNSFRPQPSELVPESYAPRDFFDPYRIPAAGDLVFLNKLSLRNFFFARSIIQQENSNHTVAIKPYILLDDSISTDYIITDFAFYTGHIDSIPDTLRNDWFFWNRLEEYLFQKYDDRKVTLYFTLSLDNTVIEEYKVKDNYYFMLADDRKEGFDSRYFGPVRRSACIGRAVMVLWSHDTDERGKWRFRFKRLGKFIP